MAADTTIVQDVLHAASRVHGAERERLLLEACGDNLELRTEIVSLLAALDQAPAFLERLPVTFAPAEPAEAPGEVIDQYLLLAPIGQGGFGVVWRARQLRPVRREVALKIVKPGMDTPHLLARFEAEQQALATLEHPGVARVYDAGVTPGGRPYFAMELVEGQPLTSHCDRRRLGVRARVALLADVCDAIHHAHQRGILHRDLKPSNVLVAEIDARPVPKVIDFGVAKALSEPLTGHSLRLTQAGQWVGTPAYMSPEQFGNDDVDVDTRSDLYSVGVLLYELLTGTTPLRLDPAARPSHAQVERLVTAHEAQPPAMRLASLPADVLVKVARERDTTPADLRRTLRGEPAWIIARCLELDRRRRYPSVAHLAEDLRRYLSGLPVEVGPPGVAYRLRKFVRRHHRALTVACVLVLSTASLVTGLAFRARYGTDTPAWFRGRVSEAMLLIRTGESESGERLLRETIQRAEQTIGPHHPVTVQIIIEYVQFLNARSRVDEAVVYDRKLHQASLAGTLDPYLAADLSNWYGGKLWYMGRYEDAVQPLTESVALQEGMGWHRQGVDKYRWTVQRLAECCERLGRLQDAARWRAKLAAAVATTQKSH